MELLLKSRKLQCPDIIALSLELVTVVLGQFKIGSRALHFSEADTLLAHVELSVVASNKHIAQDPQRASWWWDVQSNEAADALSHTHAANLAGETRERYEEPTHLYAELVYSVVPL